MKIHKLKLASEPFEAIKSGYKTIESRLYDERRQQIELGDQLLLTNRERLDAALTVEVVGLLRYRSFEVLFSHNEPTKFGGPSVAWLTQQVREFYSETEEQKYGVVGIEFVLL